MKLSARNVLPGTIVEVRRGATAAGRPGIGRLTGRDGAAGVEAVPWPAVLPGARPREGLASEVAGFHALLGGRRSDGPASETLPRPAIPT